MLGRRSPASRPLPRHCATSWFGSSSRAEPAIVRAALPDFTHKREKPGNDRSAVNSVQIPSQRDFQTVRPARISTGFSAVAMQSEQVPLCVVARRPVAIIATLVGGGIYFKRTLDQSAGTVRFVRGSSTTRQTFNRREAL